MSQTSNAEAQRATGCILACMLEILRCMLRVYVHAQFIVSLVRQSFIIDAALPLASLRHPFFHV